MFISVIRSVKTSIFIAVLTLTTLASPALAQRSTSTASTASIGEITALGVADTYYLTYGQSASALFSVGRNWIQALFGINQSRSAFSFGVGGAYKFTIAGDRRTGFHVGPGFTVGTVHKDFAFTIHGMFGGHFTIFERLILSVDAGPIFEVIDGDADFRLRPMGNALGLSLHYIL